MGSAYPQVLEELIEALKGLPGIGRRSAERTALALLKWRPEKLQYLGEHIAVLADAVTRCPCCGNLSEKGELCPICSDPHRDGTQICVVEDFSQIFSIEKSGSYQEVYHVLGGKLSPLEQRSAEELSVDRLLTRLETQEVKELILALNSDVEGRATAIYLAELCTGKAGTISQLAQGLPAGADIGYADGATISAALSGRVKL